MIFLNGRKNITKIIENKKETEIRQSLGFFFCV